MIAIDLNESELEYLARLCEAEAERPGQLSRNDVLGRSKRRRRYLALRDKLVAAKRSLTI